MWFAWAPQQGSAHRDCTPLPPRAELFLGDFCLSASPDTVTARAGFTGRGHTWGCGRTAHRSHDPARMTRRENNSRNGP